MLLFSLYCFLSSKFPVVCFFVWFKPSLDSFVVLGEFWVCELITVVVVVVVVVEIFIHGAVKATVTNAPQSQLNK